MTTRYRITVGPLSGCEGLILRRDGPMALLRYNRDGWPFPAEAWLPFVSLRPVDPTPFEEALL